MRISDWSSDVCSSDLRHLLARTTDPEVDWLRRADKAIRRDVHKMHAFVRFRRLGEEAGRESFAAWFEPSHRILRLTAPFFQRRFTGMDWAIVTPDARAIRSEAHTSELQSLMRRSYAVFCLKK